MNQHQGVGLLTCLEPDCKRRVFTKESNHSQIPLHRVLTDVGSYVRQTYSWQGRVLAS